MRVSAEAFSASTEECDVHIGSSYLQRDERFPYSPRNSGSYRLRVEDDGLLIDMNLSSRTPAWRPDTGHFVFGDSGRFGWLVAASHANTSGVAIIQGETLPLHGNGYLDHNFGNQHPASLMEGWQWYHGCVNSWTRNPDYNSPPLGPRLDFAVVGAQLTARERYGGNAIQVFMGCEDNSVYSQGGQHIKTYQETGAPIAQNAFFRHSDRADRFDVTFEGVEEIARRPSIVGGHSAPSE